MRKETVYIDEGTVYKTNTSHKLHPVIEGQTIINTMISTDGVTSAYYSPTTQSAEDIRKLDLLIPIESIKKDQKGEVWIKRYVSTTQYLEMLGVESSKGVDINKLGLSLCPDVSIWGGIGEIVGTSRVKFLEAYFNVTSSNNMKDIADFYGLLNPLPIDNDLDSDRSDWTIREYPSIGVDLVLGSIVFRDYEPSLLKIYKYSKEEADNNG